MKKIKFTSDYSMRFWEETCAKLKMSGLVSLEVFTSKFPKCYVDYFELDLFTIDIHNKELTFDDLISLIYDYVPFATLDKDKIVINIAGNGSTLLKNCDFTKTRTAYQRNQFMWVKEKMQNSRVIVTQTSGYSNYIFRKYNEMMG